MTILSSHCPECRECCVRGQWSSLGGLGVPITMLGTCWSILYPPSSILPIPTPHSHHAPTAANTHDYTNSDFILSYRDIWLRYCAGSRSGWDKGFQISNLKHIFVFQLYSKAMISLMILILKKNACADWFIHLICDQFTDPCRAVYECMSVCRGSMPPPSIMQHQYARIIESGCHSVSHPSTAVQQCVQWCSPILTLINTIFIKCANRCILEAMKTLSWKGILSNTLSTPATAKFIRKTLNGARLFLQRLPIDEMCTPMQIDVTVGEHYCHCVQCKEHVGVEITGR